MHHVVQVHDTVAVLVSATVTLTAQYATGTPPPATGSGSGTVTVTGTGHGEAPQTFEVTADDTPWIMWQILLRLDDLANAGKPPVTVGQVYDRLIGQCVRARRAVPAGRRCAPAPG